MVGVNVGVGVGDGTIIEQLVRGYTLEDQVLRHAMVKVSAGPDPDASTAENTKAEPESESPTGSI